MAVFCCCRGEKYRSAEGRIETPHPRLPTRPLPTGARSSPCPRPNEETAAGPVVTKVPRTAGREVPLEDATLDPAALDVEDSDDDNDGGRRVTKNSSTSTLEGLKARFVRHLSQQTEPRPQVQRAVHTEEELARRAELKRLRHKRIQEELQMDREEESRHRTPRRLASASSSSGELPRVGPRDAIEFGVGHVGDLHPAQRWPLRVATIPLGLPIAGESASNLSRWRSSCSEPRNRPPKHSSAAHGVHIRPMCSLPHLPSSHPDSVHLPGVDPSPSFESWRLSYSAGNIAISQEEVQPHGYQTTSAQESSREDTQPQVDADPDVGGNRDTMYCDVGPELQKETPYGEAQLNNSEAAAKTASVKGVALRSHGEVADGDSPLDLWLRVQAKALAHDESQRQINNNLSGRSYVATSAGVQHGIERGGVLPLTKGSTHLNDSVLLRAPGSTPKNREYSQSPSQDSSRKLQDDKALSELDGQSPRPRLGSSSCQHTTQPNNNKPTTSSLNSDIPGNFSLSQNSGVTQLPQTNRAVTPSHPGDLQISGASSYRTAPAKAITPEPAAVRFKCSSRRPTLDAQSVAGFETASFKQREAELNSVARRFVSYGTPREPSTPIVSKFHEEFDQENAAKSTLFARFRHSKRSKTTRRRLAKGHPAEKGPHRNCVADALDASHLAAAQSRSRSTSPHLKKAGRHDLKPSITNSATDLWQRAVRLEADRREALRRDREKYNEGHHEEESEKPAVRSASALPFMEEGAGPNLQRPYPYDAGSSHGNNTVGPWFYPSQKSRLPILSGAWAKWPSHTRAERTGSAGQSNNVTPRDFAAIGGPATGNTSIPSRSSMSTTLARALRNSIAKIKPGYDVSPKSWERLAREKEKKHRKYVRDLEYPELELPPALGGVEELQALETQINRIKHHTGSPDRRSSHTTLTAGGKTPLSLRLAQEMHQLRHEDEEVLAESHDVLNSGNPKSFITPRLSPVGSAQRHVSTATTERFLTPTSHLSYGDCMPSQVLDDDGEVESVKSDSRILVRRPRSDTEHRVPGPPKYMTWSGRAKTQPVLLKSTQEFGAELERMMAQERNKIMGSRTIEGG